MGSKVELLELSSRSHCDDDVLCVHARGSCGGDGGTLCGIPLVGGGDLGYGEEINLYKTDVKKPIDCQQCISELESRHHYKKRNGQWY